MPLVSHFNCSRFLAVAAITVPLFGVAWLISWLSNKGIYFYFDPQDFVRSNPKARVFPKSAENATFEPLLKHYIGVTQLLITVAAASIALGGTGSIGSSGSGSFLVSIAKLLLAWSIFYGAVFCALLLWRYDEYAQDMQSYTRFWYSAVQAFGFSCLICFMLGYLIWGWGLSKTAS